MAVEERSLEFARLGAIAVALFEEAYYGPPNPRSTWFTDNEAEAGILGVLERLSAAEASAPLPPERETSVASHAGHILYALSLANRAARGENPYPSADWSGSWRHTKVTDSEWKELLRSLRKEYEEYRSVITGVSGPAWKDEESITGLFATIAHGAWHLGAIRQGLGLAKKPL